MQFYQLVLLADVPRALGALHGSRLFFAHQNATPRTEPLVPEAVTRISKAEVFRLLRSAYEA